MDSKRLACIDTLRFLAIWAIIIIHAHYYFSWADKDITGSFNIPSWLLDKACSFAVPLFYIISGYFLGKSFLKEKNITKICLRHIQRLLIVFIAWSFIYSLDSFQPFSTYQWPIINQHGWIHAYYWHLQDNYFKNPVILLMIGGAGHLWFISALIQSIILILLFVSLNKEKFLIYFALLAYALTPLAIHYLHPLPGYDYDWNPMIGPFNSIPPVVLGWWFSKKKESRQSTAFLLLITGIALLGGELANKFYGFNLPFMGANSLLLPFSLFIFTLLNPQWSSNSILPILGRMTLGIYCVHPLVMHHLEFLKNLTPQYLWIIPLILLTYLISLCLVLFLRIYPWTRNLVI